MNKVYEFLKDMADHEIIHGKKYSFRIEISDGGVNSYIGFDADVEDFSRKSPVLRSVSIYRHTNSTDNLPNTWTFSLGDICNPLDDYPDIALYFGSYGKSSDDAEIESAKYFAHIKQKIRKITAARKAEEAKSAEEEKEKLLARLHELGVDADA